MNRQQAGEASTRTGRTAGEGDAPRSPSPAPRSPPPLSATGCVSPSGIGPSAQSPSAPEVVIFDRQLADTQPRLIDRGEICRERGVHIQATERRPTDRKRIRMSKTSVRCKEIGGHTDEQDKCFFKIMYGDFRHRVTIPPKFIKHFKGEIPRVIKLDSYNGYSFNVHVVEVSEKVVLELGWEIFVSVHDLKMGDFLVFKYDGNSCFKVLIFDPSGCEKSSPRLSSINNSLGGQGLEDVINISNHYCEIERRSARNKTIYISSSSSSSDPSVDALSPEDDKDAHFVCSPILRNVANLTKFQANEMKQKIHAIHSKLPIYGTVMTKCNISENVCFLDISAKYADAYLPCEDQTLILQCHDKSWNVGLIVNKYNCKRFYKGWRKFREQNNLQIGDLCLFELLKKNECKMNVYIIRRK